jgi:hypothetical protein
MHNAAIALKSDAFNHNHYERGTTSQVTAYSRIELTTGSYERKNLQNQTMNVAVKRIISIIIFPMYFE